MPVEDSLLWSVLRAQAPRHEEQVRTLVEHAAGLLLTVRDTFPTYTLHDERHAENLVRIMGDLLRPGIDDLSGLEAAMLILAAYFHDIGMVYTRAELNQLTDEEEFETYLQLRPLERLKVHDDRGVAPQDVLENYCRFRHADRVREHLNRVDKAWLRWGSVQLTPVLATVCRSHNLPVEVLKGEEFKTDFYGECDLRMCAIMLRLADILDFDKSRTPAAVYQHLGLADRNTEARTVSDQEWRKHLVSDGFRFPDERPPGYRLGFAAGPDHPAVEHGIRCFLDVIDDELRRCRSLLDFCGDRWRRLPMPSEVDRSDIHSDGYKYGEFTFELDRSAVLNLFVGQDLYQNPYAFVRELLQNAIDAVRLRMLLGLHDGDEPMIDVESWEDDGGFVWFRIDDSGTGMDEEILRRYFLRVGRSYYESAELKADLIHRAELEPGGEGVRRFGAISRFGIGVLSCFLSGDRVELSTRRIHTDGSLATPLRLSMASADDFFTLREHSMPAAPLRGRFGSDPKEYRNRPGTGILVRIDPTKVDVTPDQISREVDDLVICPPVPVRFNGRPAGALLPGSLSRPALPEPDELSLRLGEDTWSPDEPPRVVIHVPEERLDRHYRGAIRLVRLPLDLVGASPTPSLSGQLGVVAVAEPVTGPRDFLAGWPSHVVEAVPTELRMLLADAVATVRVYRQGGPGVARGRTNVTVVQELSEPTLLRIGAWLVAHQWPVVAILDRDAGQLNRVLRQLRDWYAEEVEHSSHPSESQQLTHRTLIPFLRTDIDLRDDLLGAGVLPGTSHNALVRWSHNGIAVPARRFPGTPRTMQPTPGELDVSSASRSVESSIVIFTGAVALTDGLRPDVSTARDNVTHIPFSVRSALHLALRRAAAPYLDGAYSHVAMEIIRTDLFAQFQPAVLYTLGDILSDSLVADGMWDGERLWEVDREAVNLYALRRSRSRQIGAVVLRGTEDGYFANNQLSIYDMISRALLQTAADLSWNPDQPGFIRIGSKREPELPPGLRRFPPLSFVRYTSRPKALRLWPAPANQDHPFARWLIQHIDTMADRMPALLHRLRYYLDRSEDVRAATMINETLDQIRRAAPDLAPPEHAYLRKNISKDGRQQELVSR